MTKQLSERALMGRINRRLAKDGEQLRACAYGSRWFADRGRYYVTNQDGAIVCSGIDDLDKWAAENFGREIVS